jgi:hypothetical protein
MKTRMNQEALHSGSSHLNSKTAAPDRFGTLFSVSPLASAATAQ